MNDPLSTNCDRVREYLDAYLTGETSALVRDEVSGHLSGCPQCAAELDLRRKLRESLRGAVLRSPVPPFLEAKLRRSLSTRRTNRTSLWIWAPGFALAAVLAVVLVNGWIGQQLHPWQMAKADQATFIDALYAQVTAIMRVGLGDHLHCAYFREFPNDPPTAEVLVEKIGPQYAALLPAIREHAPAGHRVLLAHQCVFQDRSFIHVALDDHGKLVSLVITRKQPGEQLNESSAGSAAAGPGAAIYQASAEQFAIAAFDAGDFLAFVVSDHEHQDNVQRAANLAAPVRKVLAESQG